MLWKFFICRLVVLTCCIHVWYWRQSQHYLHLIHFEFISRALSVRHRRSWWWTAIAFFREAVWKCRLLRDPTTSTAGLSTMQQFALVWIPKSVFDCFHIFLVVQCVVRYLLALSRRDCQYMSVTFCTDNIFFLFFPIKLSWVSGGHSAVSSL